MILDLLIPRWLQTRFAELLILHEMTDLPTIPLEQKCSCAFVGKVSGVGRDAARFTGGNMGHVTIYINSCKDTSVGIRMVSGKSSNANGR